jgi:hypothetical protein
MATTDTAFTLTGLIQIDFPSGTVRLCDGGFVNFGADRFDAKDAVFGTIAAASEIEESITDFAPGGSITLSVSPDAPLSTILNPAIQNARVQMWLAEVSSDGFTILAGSADKLFDGFVDYTTWQPLDYKLSIFYATKAEHLLMRNKGNVLSSSFHKRVWPGELGCDNATDAEIEVAWGTASPTRGTAYSGGSTGGLGALMGGSGWVDGQSNYISAAGFST